MSLLGEGIKTDILLVDDRVENLVALEAVLDSPEYNLVKAGSGDEALRYLLDHEPALILMDVQMPDLDGFATAAIIKRSERTREIPIIFITAINSDEMHLHKGYDFGAVDYIYKPYDSHILRSKVAVFVDLARKTAKLLQTEKMRQEAERRERDRQIAHLELRSLRRERADQRKYRELVNGIHHGVVWSANPDTLELTFVSPSSERILGYGHEDWASEPGFLMSHMNAEDRERFLSAVKEVIHERRDVGIEHRFKHASRGEVWLHTGMRISARASGGGREIRGLSVDITRLKEADEELRRSKERADLLSEVSLALAGSLDYETTLTRVGRLAVPTIADWYLIHLLTPGGEIRALPITHSDPGKDALANKWLLRYPIDPKAEAGVAAVIQRGESELYSQISDEMLQAVAQDDEHLRVMRKLGFRSTIIVPIVARGKTLGAMTLILTKAGRSYGKEDLAVAEDLARRVGMAIDNANLYKEAQAAIRVRDEFLSIASHELKTPITPLKIQTQALMRMLRSDAIKNVNPDRLERILETSDRQLGRLSKLTDELLDVSRISAGKLVLDVAEFDLTELLTDVVERFSDALANAGCKVIFKPQGPSRVRGDRFRIEQVIVNLLTNAMKYGSGKPLEITLHQNGDSVSFSVSDHGIGIGPEDLERIFGRFERAVKGTNISGLGLGLYIVKQIVDAHGGKVQVQSALNEGSTFEVQLPAA